MSWSTPDARPRPAAAAPYGTVLPARRSTWRADLLAGAFTTAVCVLLGAPAGLLWSAVAPHARVDISANGATFANATTEAFVAADGWFFGVAILAGMVTGIVAWLVARGSGPYVVVALALGGLLAALVASKVGMWIGQEELRTAAALGQPGRYLANVALQAEQVVFAWPIAALAAFGTLVVSLPDRVE